MIRPELVKYLNKLGTDRLTTINLSEPFTITINGIRYSAASNQYSALLLRDSSITREVDERCTTAIRSWIFDSINDPKKLVDLSDLRQWCAPKDEPSGWCDDETQENGVDFPPNRGSLFGVRINRQLLWDLIAPLPGNKAVITVSMPDKRHIMKPFIIESDEWIAVLMPHHQERTLMCAEEYPEYEPTQETAE